ncbi:MAG TPA: hypothetical protein VHX43_14005 [Xanthobacteraceae bacterium]|jgi:hypothetical protein|nr:hypothetical protein [Xanthobacteraceae bacterium]
MISKSGNRKRLTGSQLGYHGKGMPDQETISALQIKYCDAVVASGLPTAIRFKLERARALAAKALRGEEDKLHESEISRLFDEIVTISSELTPILYFKADDVDWDK